MKQATTFIYRHINHTKKSTATKSLKHSLRLKDESFRELEWNDKLTSKNSFIVDDNNLKLLSSFSHEELKFKLNEILNDEYKKPISSDTKKRLSQYKAKLNKKIKESDGELKSLLERVKNDGAEVDFNEELKSIKSVPRKKQLLNMLTTYSELHNICSGADDKRAAKIHEAFFKFPLKNGVTLDKIKAANVIMKFYNKYAPHYPLKALVIHDDERLDDQAAGLGLHPHIFISTMNSKTGKRDLTKTLKAAVNSHLKLNPKEVVIPHLKDGIKSTITEKISAIPAGYQGTKIFGSVMQDLFFEHIKSEFPELEIHFTEARDKRVEQRLEKYSDAKNRKADRVYNLRNYAKEITRKSHLELENVKKEKSLVTNELDKAKKDNELLIIENKTLRSSAAAIRDKIAKSAISVITKSAEYISAIANKKEPSVFKSKLLNAIERNKDELVSNDEVNSHVVKSIETLAANATPPVDMKFATDKIRKTNKPKIS